MSLTRRDALRGILTTAAALSAPALVAADKGNTAGIAITPDHTRQLIDGFGFSLAFHQARNLLALPEPHRTNLLNLLFSANGGIGFSVLRNILGDGSDADHGVSPEPAEDKFTWDNIDTDQITAMREAQKRGCTRFMSTVWSPPAWMKTTGKINDGGELKPDKYQAFADYMASYVSGYKEHFGLDIYAISPANEPDFTAEKYASCRWTGGQLKKFLRENLIPTFAAKNIGAQIVIDEHAHWSDEFINEILSDATCDKAISLVAAHAYADTKAPFMPINLRTGQFQTALAKGKRIWQTEVSAGDENRQGIDDGIYWALVLHTHMIEDNVSAWLYWWGAAVSTQRSTLVNLAPDLKSYQLSKRLFTIGQYARFIRPGYHRVDATPNPGPNISFSAYLAPDGKRLVAVAINNDSKEQPLTMQHGFAAKECIPVRTSATETHQRLPAITQTNGWQTTLAPMSVTTFVFA